MSVLCTNVPHSVIIEVLLVSGSIYVDPQIPVGLLHMCACAQAQILHQRE
jgi:hypothetical protein